MAISHGSAMILLYTANVHVLWGISGTFSFTFQQATFPTGMFNLFFHRHVTCAFYKTVVLANVHTHVLHTQRLSGHMVRDNTW